MSSTPPGVLAPSITDVRALAPAIVRPLVIGGSASVTRTVMAGSVIVLASVVWALAALIASRRVQSLGAGVHVGAVAATGGCAGGLSSVRSTANVAAWAAPVAANVAAHVATSSRKVV